MGRRRFALLSALFLPLAVIAGLLVGVAPAAQAVQTFQDRLVSDDPVNFTPHVLDGDVLAIAVVGNTVVLGGEFTQAQNAGGGTVYNRRNIVAYNRTTGAISTTFVPNLDDKVRTLAPGPDGSSVYVGGQFNNVDGQIASKITLLDINTGQKRASFKPGIINALVYDAKLVGNRLFIGGQFTKVNGQERSMLAELDPVTGALRPGAVTFAGTFGGGTTFVYKFDTDPAGTQLTAIGNFRTVNGSTRVQIATFDITGPLALMADWRTTGYEPQCAAGFQYYIRDIDYSPDGTFFVTTSTGAYAGGPPKLCDSIVRWNAPDRGQAVTPAWIDYSGGDSTYAVAITGSVVYAGGHTRWWNNPFKGDQAGPGAVAREGIEALDPVNGLPLSWNPGRTRGRGVFDMVATSDGLWVATDTDRIGNFEYHGRNAFFPLAGGKVVPQPSAPTLPADVYLANQSEGASQRIPYRVNGGGPAQVSGSGGPDWSPDTATNPSPNHNSGSTAKSDWPQIPTVDGTVPAGTPSAIFNSERFDPVGGNEMQWDFAVPAGHHASVNLYFANRCTCTDQPGERKFDVRIDGTLVLNDYDIVADVGDDVGTMKSFDITSDGNVDIDFGHVVENPLINGIEIIDNDAPPGEDHELGRRSFDGSQSSATSAAPTGSVNWANVRGAFVANGTLYRANSDRTFTAQSFDGSNYGNATTLELYGLTDFQNELSRMTGLFYSKGSIYFTLSGDNNLYRRYFTVESNVVGAQRFTVPSGGVGWGAVRGMFLASNGVYWANSAGDLHRVTWSDNGPVSGTDTVVSGPGHDGVGWRAGALFAMPGQAPNQPPSADISFGCSGLTCGFDATGSSDPDGAIVSYAWDFGDGGQSTQATPSHQFGSAGTYHVTLVVTDDDGATGSTASDVVVTDGASPITYVGSARHQVDNSVMSQRVAVPPGVVAGDVMVMAMSFNSVTNTVTDPAGWTRVDTVLSASMTTVLWTRTATAGDAGSTVVVTATAPVKSSLLLSAYRGAVVDDSSISVESASRTTHTTPTLSAPAGTWLVSVWNDKTAATSAWTAPGSERVLQTGAGSDAGHVSWLMTDSNGPVSGTVGGLTATANSATANATMMSVLLAPA
jgi:PKD repeat protein